MTKWVSLALALCLLGFFQAGENEDARLTSDLSENVRARLFVVPLRIEAKEGAQSGECASLGVEHLKIKIRDVPLKKMERLKLIEDGLIKLDRRPRPMLHAIVFDTSGSMSWDLPKAKDAARAYVDENIGPSDKGLVLGFDDAVTLWQRVTRDRAKLRDAIDRIEVGGQTSLFDALVGTIRELEVHGERPVIVLLSDGIDNASFYDMDDVLAELESRPDLVVFTISIGNRSLDSRRMLRRLATTTFGRYFEIDEGSELAAVFDKIRDTLGKEAVLTAVDPDPTRHPATIQIASLNNDCHVTILGKFTHSAARTAARTPLPSTPPTFPDRYRAPLSIAHRKILSRGRILKDVNECYDRALPSEQQPLEWVFNIEEGRVGGCAPDIALSHGYLYQPGLEQLIARNEDILVKIRPFEIPIPRLENLLRDPVDLLDRLLADLPPGPDADDLQFPSREDITNRLPAIPTLVHGTTFLEMRPRIARTLFSQPEYREWALGRLQDWIDSDLQRLEARYRAMFPDHSDDGIRFAVENSAEAMAIRARADAPTEGNLQPFLAAWLGDLHAATLFNQWECEATSRLLAREGGDTQADDFVIGWRRLRDLLSIPSNTRIVAPLIPMYQEECDCVGFYRIVLPRPSLVRARVFERSTFLALPKLDVPAKLPFGYALILALGEQLPRTTEYLGAHGYVVDNIDYELLGPPEFHDPIRAFRETRVRLDLVRPSRDGENDRERRVSLTADLHLAIPPPRPSDSPVAKSLPPRRPRWLLDMVKVEVRHDPELKALFGKPGEALAGYELLKGVRPPRPVNSSRDRALGSSD